MPLKMTWQLGTVLKVVLSKWFLTGTNSFHQKYITACSQTHDVHMRHTCKFSNSVLLSSGKSYYVQRPFGPCSNFLLPSEISLLVSLSLAALLIHVLTSVTNGSTLFDVNET
jgi:hypothetical protein